MCRRHRAFLRISISISIFYVCICMGIYIYICVYMCTLHLSCASCWLADLDLAWFGFNLVLVAISIGPLPGPRPGAILRGSQMHYHWIHSCIEPSCRCELMPRPIQMQVAAQSLLASIYHVTCLSASHCHQRRVAPPICRPRFGDLVAVRPSGIAQ